MFTPLLFTYIFHTAQLPLLPHPRYCSGSITWWALLPNLDICLASSGFVPSDPITYEALYIKLWPVSKLALGFQPTFFCLCLLMLSIILVLPITTVTGMLQPSLALSSAPYHIAGKD